MSKRVLKQTKHFPLKKESKKHDSSLPDMKSPSSLLLTSIISLCNLFPEDLLDNQLLTSVKKKRVQNGGGKGLALNKSRSFMAKLKQCGSV